MDQQSKILFCGLCLQVIFTSIFADVWKADVEPKMDALVHSCIVVPCKFNYPGNLLPDSSIRAIWHRKDNWEENIYHTDSLKVKQNFKGRTKMIGHLGQKNCSLEIDSIKDHDIGPFCFRAEIPSLDKYSFVESCVYFHMKHEPDQPQMTDQQSFEVGSTVILKCFVRHTCPSHHPQLTWNRQNSNPITSYKDNGHGVWEVESLLSFTGTEEDDHTDITCTATFNGGKTSQMTKRMYIKHEASILQIIIPVVAAGCAVLLFGVVGFFLVRKYKPDTETKAQDQCSNSLFTSTHRSQNRQRVKVKCRQNSNTPGSQTPFMTPSCHVSKQGNKSVSFRLQAVIVYGVVCPGCPAGSGQWNRRRPAGILIQRTVVLYNLLWSGFVFLSAEMLYWSHRRNEPDRNVDARPNNCNVSGTATFSKPRFPSPKSDPKFKKSGGGFSGDHYMADSNVYGNI